MLEGSLCKYKDYTLTMFVKLPKKKSNEKLEDVAGTK